MAAKSTGPTVNIQNTQATKAEQVHTAVKLAVKTMSAQGQLDNAVELQEDNWGKTSGYPPERFGVLVTAFSSKQPQQCTSLKMLMAEKQPVATDGELDERLSGNSALWESAALTSVTEKKDEEGGDANTEGRVLKSENEEGGFRFTVDPASVKEKKEGKQPSSEEDHGGEAAESWVKALEQLAGESEQMEENGRRVHFSNEVQYFEDQEFPTELEDGIEEMAEGSPPEGHKILLDCSNRRTEEYQMDGKVEELKTDGDKERDLAERDDGVAPREPWEGETDFGSNELTEPLTSDGSLTHPPSAASQSEVTPHQLRWGQPHHQPHPPPPIPPPADTLCH